MRYNCTPGRHERMHLTLKKEATKPAAKNLLQQHGRFDRFLEEHNQERPHQALGVQYPAELYIRSPQPYRGLCDLQYPFSDKVWLVSFMGHDLGFFDHQTGRITSAENCGAICKRFLPPREQNAWLEAVHALATCQEHTWHMTTEELIAVARHHRIQRPEATLERVEENLRAMLDMLVQDFDCEREPISTPALVARRLATIVADLEDTHGDKPLH